jgi:hypothetical protein
LCGEPESGNKENRNSQGFGPGVDPPRSQPEVEPLLLLNPTGREYYFSPIAFRDLIWEIGRLETVNRNLHEAASKTIVRSRSVSPQLFLPELAAQADEYLNRGRLLQVLLQPEGWWCGQTGPVELPGSELDGSEHTVCLA